MSSPFLDLSDLFGGRGIPCGRFRYPLGWRIISPVCVGPACSVCITDVFTAMCLEKWFDAKSAFFCDPHGSRRALHVRGLVDEAPL